MSIEVSTTWTMWTIPNLDASTYDDRKFIAGFDATDTLGNPQRDRTDDLMTARPRDPCRWFGTRHRGANRTHRGIAPAAGLVDVKVLTDGNSNSIQPCRAFNGSSTTRTRGGRMRIPACEASTSPCPSRPILRQSTRGHRGQWERCEFKIGGPSRGRGLVVLCAMGNDGKCGSIRPGTRLSRRIDQSPLRMTGTRSTGMMTESPYSNRGPRDPMGMGMTGMSSNRCHGARNDIIAPESEASAIALPGQDPPMADDGCTSKSGTSMATPIVAGIVALVLEAAESDGRTLDQEEVRAILHDSSEVLGQAYDPALDPDWSREWGFGHVDAQCAVARTIGDTCAGRPSSEDLNFSDPLGLRWLEVERTYRITGTTNTSFIPSIDRVELRVVRYDCKNIYGDFDLDCDTQPSTVLPWTEVEGASEWSYTLDVNASWLRSPTWYSENPDTSLTYGVQSTHHLEIRGIHGNGTILGSNWTRIDVIQRDLVIQSPAERTLVSGDVNISGFVKGVDTQTIQIRIDDGPWAEAPSTLQPLATESVFRSQSYTVTWDSGTDGLHRMHVRAINASGINTPAFERLIQVDNILPTPDLGIIGEPIVTVGDLEASQALRGPSIESMPPARIVMPPQRLSPYLTTAGSASSSYPE